MARIASAPACRHTPPRDDRSIRCMTAALAAGGIATVTCMGERRFRELVAEAGFSEVRRVDFADTPFNLFFEVRA